MFNSIKSVFKSNQSLKKAYTAIDYSSLSKTDGFKVRNQIKSKDGITK